MFVRLIFVHAAEQLPVLVEPASLSPYVGSMAMVLPAAWNWI
jgi:hypothetical protein